MGGGSCLLEISGAGAPGLGSTEMEDPTWHPCPQEQRGAKGVGWGVPWGGPEPTDRHLLLQASSLICRRQGDGVRTWAMASDPPRGSSQVGHGHLRADLSPVVPQHTHLPRGSNQYFHWLRPNLGQALSPCSGPEPGKAGTITLSILVMGPLRLRKAQPASWSGDQRRDNNWVCTRAVTFLGGRKPAL